MLTLGFCHHPAPAAHAPSCATATKPHRQQAGSRSLLPAQRLYGDDAALRGVGWIPGVNLPERPLGAAELDISKHQKYALMFSGISTLAIVANSLFNILRSSKLPK